MPELNTFLFAFFGGLIPAIIWLFFWLREDEKHPEPNVYIIRTFIFGMLMVPVALGIQLAINSGLLGYFTIEEAVKAMPVIGVISIIVPA